MKKICILVFFLITAGTLAGQNNHTGIYETSLHINNTGMYVLGSWALVNIAGSSVGWATTSNDDKYFHQMNVFWNTINLSIAGFALYANYNQDFASLSSTELLQKHDNSQNLYLINAGLDVLYMGAGSYLWHLSNKKENSKPRLLGYGKSVVLQGAFLFVFDLAMFFILQNHRMNFYL